MLRGHTVCLGSAEQGSIIARADLCLSILNPSASPIRRPVPASNKKEHELRVEVAIL